MQVRQSELTLGPKISEGGAGIIFEVATPPSINTSVVLTYKQFKDPRSVSGAALERLSDFRDSVGPKDQGFIDRRLTWPIATAVDTNAQVVGYLMPRIPEEFFVTANTATGPTRQPCHIDQLFTANRQLENLIGISPTHSHRFAYALGIAGIFQFLHRAPMIYGDLNWRNAVWNADGDKPQVMLIDCDAIRFRGEGSAVEQMHTLGWIPPESSAGQSSQTVETDRYKLSLAIMRILTPGINLQIQSYQAFAGSTGQALFDRDGRRLLQAGLSPNPADRPSVDHWVQWLTGQLGSLPTPGPLPRRSRIPPPPSPPHVPAQPPFPARKPPAVRPRPRNRLFGNLPPPAPPAPPAPPPRAGRRRGAGCVLGFVVTMIVLGVIGLLVVFLLPSLQSSPQPTSSLTPGSTLEVGEDLTSSNARYRLTMQDDGNLVLYGPSGALWSTQTSDVYGATALMQEDGNLVVYGNGALGALWSSRTSGYRGAFVTMQNDGNLVIYSPTLAAPVWSTMTAR